MIDNETKFNLLFQKLDSTERKRQRFFVFLLIIPVLYYLANKAIIQEISFSIFNVKQIQIIQFFIPSIYSIAFFYIAVMTEHNSEIQDQIDELLNQSEDVEKTKKHKWKRYIVPLNFLGEVLGSIRAGGCIGLFGAFIVFFPFIFLMVLYPFSFFIYSLYCNFKFYSMEGNLLSLLSAIFAIWMAISTLIYVKSKEYGKKVKARKKAEASSQNQS